MNKVVNIEDYRPHKTESVKCRDCSKSWQAIFPESTNISDLECPKCGVRNTMLKAMEIGCGICKKDGSYDHKICFKLRKAREALFKIANDFDGNEAVHMADLAMITLNEIEND